MLLVYYSLLQIIDKSVSCTNTVKYSLLRFACTVHVHIVTYTYNV